MEGINGPAILLGCLAVFAAGSTLLAALGLLIAGRTNAARVVFSAGLFCSALIAALTILSFLTRGTKFPPGKFIIVLTALSLLLAGAGQLAAALASRWNYDLAFGVAGAAMVLAIAAVGSADHVHGDEEIAATRKLCLAWASLLLAATSIMVAPLSGLPGLRKAGPARPATRVSDLLRLAAVNLAMLVAAVVCLKRNDEIWTGNEFADFIANTHWQLVFVVFAVSVLTSLAVFLLVVKSGTDA